jgi:2-(1,2-epoxy-1,2-dihydrophenyl)acetyl-CoA isomerase
LLKSEPQFSKGDNVNRKEVNMADELLTEIRDGIGKITLNRPKLLNSISIESLELLIKALQDFLNNSEVRVVILTGNGRAFCAGADQGEMIMRQPGEWEEIVERYLDPIRFISKSDKPVIASINGDAVGGGLGLAMACDLRIAVNTARFCTPFTAIGLAGCDMSAGYFLPRLIGLGKATEMMMTSRFVKAEEAEIIGLVQRLVEPENLEKETMKLAGRLAVLSPIALSWTKKAIRRSLDRDMDGEFDFEVFAQVQCLQTEEHRESLRQYQEVMMGKKK